MLPVLLVAAVLAIVPQRDSTRLLWVPNPREASGSWVSDPSRHLRGETRARLDAIIGMLEGETTAEIAVVVIDSLDALDPADAAHLLHRRWGVGKKERDNGIVLLWSPALRKTYVSVGYGLEGVIPDARAGRILDQDIIPAFRRNQFDEGLIAGVTALAAAAREETYSGMARNAAARPTRDTARVLRGPAAFFSVGLFVFVAGALWRSRRYWPRRCPRGHRMTRLGEKADNEFLTSEGQLEERLGSVDYDVWTCRECEHREVHAYRRWFSRFETCPKCKRRTCERSTRVTQEPTYTSTGTRVVRRRCRNCAFGDEREETIPMRTQSSSGGSGSGGSSGGSSFGGGSSGGGGAGRSY